MNENSCRGIISWLFYPKLLDGKTWISYVETTLFGMAMWFVPFASVYIWYSDTVLWLFKVGPSPLHVKSQLMLLGNV